MRTPEIKAGPYGQFYFEPGLKQLDSSSPTATLGCGIGQFVYDSSGALKVCASAAANAKYVVVGIFEKDGVTRKANGFLTNAEISSGNYLVQVAKIGNTEFWIEEDGDGGNISDANATAYADIVVSNPDAQELAVANKLPYQSSGAVIKVDSDSVNSSSTGLLIQLLGLAPIVNEKNASVDGADGPRIFRAKIIDAVAQASQ